MSDRAVGSAISLSRIETERFGLRIFRGLVDQLDEQNVLDTAIDDDIDIVMLRLPEQRQYQLARLDRTGLPWFVAGTLVWYETDLVGYSPAEPAHRDISFVLARPEHAAVLDDLVSDIFGDYRNHYASNPLLSRAAILANYQDWVRRYTTGEGRICWLVRQGDGFVAFVTCGFDRASAEIVLNGVRPSASGRGIYTDLVRYVQRHFKDRGMRTLEISTQSHNYAVQRVWNREGFRLRNAFLTVHVNALMHHSVVEPCRFELPSSSGMPALWQAAIDVAGRQCWSQPPLGKEARPLGCAVRFLRPLAGPCRAEVTMPVLDTAQRTCRSLLKVADSANRLGVFSYHDFALQRS